MTNGAIPVHDNTALDIDREIELGLRAIAERARQGDTQALKLLMAYKEEKRGDAGDAYLTALTEAERRALRAALVREITALREKIGPV